MGLSSINKSDWMIVQIYTSTLWAKSNFLIEISRYRAQTISQLSLVEANTSHPTPPLWCGCLKLRHPYCVQILFTLQTRRRFQCETQSVERGENCRMLTAHPSPPPLALRPRQSPRHPRHPQARPRACFPCPTALSPPFRPSASAATASRPAPWRSRVSQ